MADEIEEWRDVVGFERGYRISNRGRVWSKHLGRPMRPSLSSNGYMHQPLRRNGVSYSMTLHRMVAAAFIGPCPEGMCVLHRDGSRLNNDVSNLRYDTLSENNRDIARHGRRKVTVPVLADIRSMLARGMKCKRISEFVGAHVASPKSVWRIKTGRAYAYV